MHITQTRATDATRIRDGRSGPDQPATAALCTRRTGAHMRRPHYAGDVYVRRPSALQSTDATHITVRKQHASRNTRKYTGRTHTGESLPDNAPARIKWPQHHGPKCKESAPEGNKYGTAQQGRCIKTTRKWNRKEHSGTHTGKEHRRQQHTQSRTNSLTICDRVASPTQPEVAK